MQEETKALGGMTLRAPLAPRSCLCTPSCEPTSWCASAKRPATALRDGSVLIVGGGSCDCPSKTVWRTAEVYDRPVNSLPLAASLERAISTRPFLSQTAKYWSREALTPATGAGCFRARSFTIPRRALSADYLHVRMQRVVPQFRELELLRFGTNDLQHSIRLICSIRV